MQIDSLTASQATLLCVMPTTNGHLMPLTAAELPVYQLHITRFFVEFRPQGDRECAFVQRIADNEWRLDRLARVEMGYYALGQIEFAHLFPEQESSIRAVLIQAHTHKTYTRQINSVNIQEARLRRYIDKDTAELETLQTERAEREKKQKTVAATAPASAAQAPNGFEFSSSPAAIANPIEITATAESPANGQRLNQTL